MKIGAKNDEIEPTLKKVQFFRNLLISRKITKNGNIIFAEFSLKNTSETGAVQKFGIPFGKSLEETHKKIYGKCFDFATGFWLLNIFVGGLYIVLADADGFPELLSLAHLIIGVSSFFSALMAVMFIRLSSSAGGESDE